MFFNRLLPAAKILNRGLALVNLKLVSTLSAPSPSTRVGELSDCGEAFLELYARCAPYTMTSPERMYAAYQAAKYVAERSIPGAIVECGVWKGGSSMMMLLALLAHGVRDRDVYLYDTFEGMTEPGERDVDFRGESARTTWQAHRSEALSTNAWCYSPLEEARGNIAQTGYPMERVRLIKGKVEDTIPAQAPSEIALLRLDTDWYESTHHELVQLYPRLARGGVLIIDDYGHWRGAREATDRYFRETQDPVLLARIDSTGRMLVKS